MLQDTFSSHPSEELPKAFSPSQENQPSQTNGEETHRSPTLSSKEMPLWLRSELEATSPQEIEEVGATPEGTEREVRQFREELASTQRQTAAMGTQPSYLHESQYRVKLERGGCLTAWLIFAGILNALALILGFVMTSTVGPFGLLIVANGVLALIGVVGTWQLKKWGYSLLVTLYIISAVTGLLSSSVTALLGSLLGLGITTALVMNRWEDFE